MQKNLAQAGVWVGVVGSMEKKKTKKEKTNMYLCKSAIMMKMVWSAKSAIDVFYKFGIQLKEKGGRSSPFARAFGLGLLALGLKSPCPIF